MELGKMQLSQNSSLPIRRQNTLSANPNLSGIYATNDPEAERAVQALRCGRATWTNQAESASGAVAMEKSHGNRK